MQMALVAAAASSAAIPARASRSRVCATTRSTVPTAMMKTTRNAVGLLTFSLLSILIDQEWGLIDTANAPVANAHTANNVDLYRNQLISTAVPS